MNLRNRLVLAAVLVQVLVLGALVWNGARLIEQGLKEQITRQINDNNLLLTAALSAPLVERDVATLRDVVGRFELAGDFVRIEVLDEDGRTLAGYVRSPATGEGIAGHADVVLGGHRYGSVDYLVSGKALAESGADMLRQNGILALLALVFSGVLLFALVYWMSRHFQTLIHASEKIASGNFDVVIPETRDDEVGKLTRAFNHMAQSVRDDMARIRERERQFNAIANYTHDLEFWLSPAGELLWVNPSVLRMLGYSVQECMQQKDFPLCIVHDEDRLTAEFQLRAALKGSTGSGYVFRAQRKDGSVFWAAANWQPIYDEQAQFQGLRASMHDVDDLKQTEASLREAVAGLRMAENLQARYLQESEEERARLVSLLSAMNLGILFVGAEGRVVYHNPAFNQIWSLDENRAVIGQPVVEVLAHSTPRLANPAAFSGHLAEVLRAREQTSSFEIMLRDGRVINELDYPVRDHDDGFIGYLWIYEDVTRERQIAGQLVYLAERDPLTGLYNRYRFQSELKRLMLEAQRGGHNCVVMFFDLDEFKTINDNFGHRAGDALLIRIAGEIGGLVRRNELFARLGGDEFALLLPSSKQDEAEALAERVVRAVAQTPFHYEGQNLRLSASLGIAYYPEHAVDADDLVARADMAMYQAKQAGKNTWRVYRPEMQKQADSIQHLNWAERISRALENNLFRLHYQGIYHTRDGRLSHLEALIRMLDEAHPGQLIMPVQFIPVAEKSGRILDIDRWVLGEAVRVLAAHPELPGMAVNLSGRSLNEPNLANFIGETLRQHAVSPGRLLVELTETAAVADLHDTRRLIDELTALGCDVCLDDFGTGFASFSYLKHLRAQVLKIDGIFIRDLHADPDNQIFVRAMVDVARSMGKTVVAEYVENAETLATLTAFGVDLVQGYHLDRPSEHHPALNPLPPVSQVV
jgi:diguanylate cyclase (GGDEF)-like protein/PAS domain S-box-containing protein